MCGRFSFRSKPTTYAASGCGHYIEGAYPRFAGVKYELSGLHVVGRRYTRNATFQKRNVG
jgi:hypothetical protein